MILHGRMRRDLGVTGNLDEMRKVTVMLLSVTVTYCVLTIPITVYIICADFELNHTEKDYLWLIVLSNLPFLNMSLNFYLYCLSGKMFRDEVRQLIRRFCRRCCKIKEAPSREYSTKLSSLSPPVSTVL